jgi:hypothetical protein
MVKKKVKRIRKKKIKFLKGNSFIIPRYIPPRETMIQRIWRWISE